MRNKPGFTVALLALLLAVGGLCIGTVSTPSLPSAGAPDEASICTEGRGCSTSAQCDSGICFRHRCFC